MVTINCAYTESINPAGSSPTLTKDQVWKALQIKTRHPQGFVPIISSSEILEEKENEVTRKAHFMERDAIPAHTVVEVCKSYYPTRVDFWQPDGALIANTISDGPDGALYLTFTFEWRHEDVTEGSSEHTHLAQKHLEAAATAVHKSIETTRQMVLRGEVD